MRGRTLLLAVVCVLGCATAIFAQTNRQADNFMRCQYGLANCETARLSAAERTQVLAIRRELLNRQQRILQALPAAERQWVAGEAGKLSTAAFGPTDEARLRQMIRSRFAQTATKLGVSLDGLTTYIEFVVISSAVWRGRDIASLSSIPEPSAARKAGVLRREIYYTLPSGSTSTGSEPGQGCAGKNLPTCSAGQKLYCSPTCQCNCGAAPPKVSPIEYVTVTPTHESAKISFIAHTESGFGYFTPGALITVHGGIVGSTAGQFSITKPVATSMDFAIGNLSPSTDYWFKISTGSKTYYDGGFSTSTPPLGETSFQNYDQKVSQLMNLLSQVIKTMNEMRQAGGRCMDGC